MAAEKRLTMADVARAAGVTSATVSLVLAGNPRITEETRTRVMDVVQTLGYRPHRLAQQLAGGRNHTVVVLARHFSAYFEMEFMRGLQEALAATPYHLHQYSTKGNPDYGEDLFDQILYENRAEGVVALNLKPSPVMLEAYQRAGIPVVLVEEEMEGALGVRCDSRRGTQAAMEHLLGRGRKQVALVSNTLAGEGPGSSSVERRRAWAESLAAASLPRGDDLVYVVPNPSTEEGVRILDGILRDHPDLDAILCAAGDLVAFGILKRAKELGLGIPQDLAVIGFDDHFAAELVNPALTTVRQPIFTMGTETVALLTKAMEAPQGRQPEGKVYQTDLVIRETS